MYSVQCNDKGGWESNPLKFNVSLQLIVTIKKTCHKHGETCEHGFDLLTVK